MKGSEKEKEKKGGGRKRNRLCELLGDAGGHDSFWFMPLIMGQLMWAIGDAKVGMHCT